MCLTFMITDIFPFFFVLYCYVLLKYMTEKSTKPFLDIVSFCLFIQLQNTLALEIEIDGDFLNILLY